MHVCMYVCMHMYAYIYFDQVTMALGAGKMAREFDSVVTSLPALQDISSMTVLCSDKTGKSFEMTR